MAFNQGCRGIVPNDQLDPVYLFYFLAMSRDLLNELGTGTTFKELSTSNLKNVAIPLPSLEEQQRIVAVLDEAFEGLARARAHAVANFQNARELFESALEADLAAIGHSNETSLGEHIDLMAGHAFKSAGYSEDKNAMRLMRGDNIIPGAVRWEKAKYWPIDDCQGYEKFRLMTNDVLIAMDRTWIKSGIKHAVLTDDDIPCLLVQRVARLRCLTTLNNQFLAILIGSKSFEQYVLSIQTGTGVPHISPAQIKDFTFTRPDIDTQGRIVERLLQLKESCADLSDRYAKKLQDLDDLRQSLLQKAFAGELTRKKTSQITNVAVSGEKVSCLVLAIAYSRHASVGREKTFGHVKAQKILHLAEAVCHLELGRDPIKDAAGPNDIVQMNRAEALAKKNNHFEFRKRSSGGYTFVTLAAFGGAVREAENMHKDQLKSLVGLVDLLVPMDTTQAEVLTTVFAAWNNLIIDGETISDEAIIRAAREEWHQDKLKIGRPKFSAAIGQIKAARIEPDGTAKYVRQKQERLL